MNVIFVIGDLHSPCSNFSWWTLNELTLEKNLMNAMIVRKDFQSLWGGGGGQIGAGELWPSSMHDLYQPSI